MRLNGTPLAWLGYTREELVANATVLLLLPVGGRLHYEMHALPLLQGEVRELSYQLRRKDGNTQPVLLSARLLRDPDGQPLVVRLTFFDITERHRYEQELRRTYALAQEHSTQLAQANAQLMRQNEGVAARGGPGPARTGRGNPRQLTAAGAGAAGGIHA